MSRYSRLHEREERSRGTNDRRSIRDFAFLLAGIGIGSGVALLLAPSEGEEVRHAIGRGYRKTVKRIGRQAEALRDRAEDFLDHAHDLRERGSRLLDFARAREAERRGA